MILLITYRNFSSLAVDLIFPENMFLFCLSLAKFSTQQIDLLRNVSLVTYRDLFIPFTEKVGVALQLNNSLKEIVTVKKWVINEDHLKFASFLSFEQ